MQYTGPDDTNLPEDIKGLSELEKKVYILIFNPVSKKYGDELGDSNARSILTKWQNHDLSVRGA